MKQLERIPIKIPIIKLDYLLLEKICYLLKDLGEDNGNRGRSKE